MFRGALMRGGVIILTIAVLWLPVSSVMARSHDPAEPTPGISISMPGDWWGYVESLWTFLSNLAGADESGGTFEPNGQSSAPNTTCGGAGQDPCPAPTTTTTSTETGTGGLVGSTGS